MTRLNKNIKDQIVVNAISKAGLYAKRDELVSLRVDWAERVRLEAMGGKEMDEEINKLHSEISEKLDSVPWELVQYRDNFIRTTMIVLNLNGYRIKARFNGSRNYAGTCVYKLSRHEYTLKAGNPLIADFLALDSLHDKTESQIESITQNVYGVLAKVTTVKKLLEVWPEASELLPSDMSPIKKQEIAIRTDDLNSMIGLPSKG